MQKVLKTQRFPWELSWLKQEQDIPDCILTVCSWENSWPLRGSDDSRQQIVFIAIIIPYKKNLIKYRLKKLSHLHTLICQFFVAVSAHPFSVHLKCPKFTSRVVNLITDALSFLLVHFCV